MKKIILSHPTGNANVRAALQGLLLENILAEYHTTIATFPGSLIDKLGYTGPLAELGKRRYRKELAGYTYTSPWTEAGRLLANKIGVRRLTKHESGVFSVDSVYRNLDKRVSQQLSAKITKGIDSVYCYEDGALSSFRRAGELGINKIYDLPIGYWRTMRRLLQAERDNRPEWASTLTGFRDSESKLSRKDEEIRLANHIIVASTFTAKTLDDFGERLPQVSIIPYGFPPVSREKKYHSLDSRPLKLLFVGGLSQRKGIANVFEAVEPLGKHVELTIVGRKPVDDCEVLNNSLSRHNWIASLPHDQILQLMQESDVLLFPSLFEGFGLVITEAMSQGTPVITTERTAGPDLITHNENGWITEAGNSDALKHAIARLLEKPQRIKEAGEAAMGTAERRPWSVYGSELAFLLKGIN